ncbi:MAG: azurin [Balneola sp.]
MNLFISMLMVLFISNPFNTSDMAPETTTQKTEIVIEGNDQMRFNLSEIKVKAGETVTLTLKHTGKLPKAAMGHNWVLLAAGTDVKTFATEAMKARDNEYIPEGSEQILAYTALIGGGEETTIEFTVSEAGEYDFICSFPGHYALMKGKLIVE